ncbi:MAG: methionine--tRNA ligase [Simkaniaceae bacterium]|nr:methionine--tRNA ligase [Simkaniaceae bacterium]
MGKRVLITAALPYANGFLHFGHIAGAYLPADVYARFKRLEGCDVLYICGSDEHGVPITLSAEMAGKKPWEYVDFFHEAIADFFKKFAISFDHYSRTTQRRHGPLTQAFFRDLNENGYIEARITNQLYSPKDGRFLADRYVIGRCPRCDYGEARGDECPECGAYYEATDLKEPKSKLTGAPLLLRPTKHWFLRFDLFKDRLKEWMARKQWKANVTSFAQNYIADLRPRAITRDSDWGVPVPLDEAKGKVFYVWFDAPIGYISATMEWAEEVKKEPDAWKKYWLDPDTSYVQFIGKDNIPFHAIFFPAMIMGQNTPYKLVDELPANEFYLFEGKQFSKSSGHTIDLRSFLERFSVDQARYVIAAGAPETQDGEFSRKDFQTRCNAELLGKYGNLANRVLLFTKRVCGRKRPRPGALADVDTTFLVRIERIVREIRSDYSAFRLRKATRSVMELAASGNVYFDTKKPWKGVGEESLKEAMLTTLALSLRCLDLLALISYPIIPETAERLWRFLGYTTPLALSRWDETVEQKMAEGALIDPTPLFKRVEGPEILGLPRECNPRECK